MYPVSISELFFNMNSSIRALNSEFLENAFSWSSKFPTYSVHLSHTGCDAIKSHLSREKQSSSFSKDLLCSSLNSKIVSINPDFSSFRKAKSFRGSWTK